MIFVTGGTGLLGNCIVRELCARNIPTRALCRKGTSQDCFEGLPVEVVEGDLSSTSLLSNAVAGCTAVIHSAAMIHIGWHNLAASREVNVEGTRRVVEACQAHRARLLYVSTVDTLPAAVTIKRPLNEQGFDEDGTPGVEKTPCTYVLSKREAEQVVRDKLSTSDLDAIILNPGFMLSPFDWKPSSGRMMLEVNKAPLLAAPPGGCSVCDARDVATAIVNGLENGTSGENYILAGENMSYQDLWTAMLKPMNRKKKVFRIGPLVRLAGKVIDFGIRILPIKEGDINGAAISMGSLNHAYCSAKAERELGYKCRNLDTTLADSWAWLKEQHLK